MRHRRCGVRSKVLRGRGLRRLQVQRSSGGSRRDLLLAGATSGQIGVAFSVLAIGFQFLDNFFPEDFVRRLVETLAPNWLMVVLILLPTGLLLAWLRDSRNRPRLLWFHALPPRGLPVYQARPSGAPRGDHTALPHTGRSCLGGLLRQPFGLASLRVESAGYGEDSGVSTTLFPLLPRNEVEELLAGAAPEFAGAPAVEPLPRRALRRYVFRATVLYTIIAFAAALVSFLVFQSAWASRALPDTTRRRVRMACYRDAGWAFEEDRLVVRHRAWAARRPSHARSPAVAWMVSSPFQRRVRLATFLAEVASGSGGSVLRVKDLDGGAAKALVDDLGPGVRLEGA